MSDRVLGGPGRPRRPLAGSQDSGDDILMVAGFVPGDPFRSEDRSVHTLITDLAGLVGDARMTLVAADGFRAEPVVAGLRQLGIEVCHGPMDWRGWFSANVARFSHVFMTWSGLHSNLGSWIRRSQPQAVKVMYLPGMAFRDVEALRPYTPVEELPGLEWLRVESEARLADLATWVDAVWCDQEADASFVRGLRRFPSVSVVPPAVSQEAVADLVPAPERSGIVIVASEGHDLIKANEEAAQYCLRHLLPALRRRRRQLSCTVLSEAPTPRLDTACRAQGAHLVSLDQAAAIGRAELVLVGHQHGTGGQTTILAAVAARTPFVTTPLGAAELDLGALAPHAVFAATEDLVLHARRLLDDAGARRSFVDQIDALAAGPLSRRHREAALATALPFVGLTPPIRPHVPLGVRQAPMPSRLPLARVQLRPAGWVSAPAAKGPDPEDEASRYLEWCRRFGPNRTTLDALCADLEAASHRPTISLLLSVQRAEAKVLAECVASVSAQLYPRWQLCVVVDGSERPETLAVVDALADDRIVVTREPTQPGRTGTTNAALATATGEFVTFVEPGDLLKPHALVQVVRWLNADPSLDIIYPDHDRLDAQGAVAMPNVKPDWSPDFLAAHDYVGHLIIMRRRLVDALGGLRRGFDGSEAYDLLLRASQRSERVAHIPEPLYTIRQTDVGREPPAEAWTSGRRAVADLLARQRVAGRVEHAAWPGWYRTHYRIPGQPKVSIIIPTKDGGHLLRRCIGSIMDRTTYRNYELVIIDNQSTAGDALGYIGSLPARVIHYPHRFNYARMLNLAATTTEADALLFLNNDTEVISPGWIEALLEHAMRPEVGAVGGRLRFGDGRPQHEGIFVGVTGWAWNIDGSRYGRLGESVRNTSAVTGACTMMRPSVYWRVGGNDERLRVAYNDVDICLRIRQAGLQIIYTPYAELFHWESSSRSGYEHHEDGPLFGLRWEPRQRVDPYYSPVFHRDVPFRIGLGEPEMTFAVAER